MDPITIIIATSFAASLAKVGEKLLDKAGVYDPAGDLLKSFLRKNYDAQKAAETLRQTVAEALEETRASLPEAANRISRVWKMEGHNAEVYDLLAACAVEMVKPNPKNIPDRLALEMRIFLDRDRELFAGFLFILRKHLAKSDGFDKLIAYANDLDRRGLLEGLAKRIEQLIEEAKQFTSYLKLVLAERHVTDKDELALEKYYELGRKEWGGLMLPMIRQRTGDEHPYRLKQIFVPLLLQDKRAEEKARQKMERDQRKLENIERADDEQTRPVGYTELMTRYNTFILIGKPGCGKTTLLRRAALAFAEGRADEELNWKGKPLFPIFIRLRNFGEFLNSEAGERFCDPAPGALLEYLRNRYQNGEYMDLTPDFFSRRLDEGNCLVLLDGLDEVAQKRDVVAQHVNAFAKRFKEGNYFGMSSRPGGYGRDEETALRDAQLAVAEVAPLDPGGIRQLIENLLTVMEWDNGQERTAAVQRLPQKILASRDLTDIASIPLFCAALVQVYKYNKADLPERRVDVLDEIVALLLGHWHASKGEVTGAKELGLEDGTQKIYRNVAESVDYKKRRLRYLAHYMHTNLKQYEIDSETARQVLAEYFIQKERVKDGEIAEQYAEGFLRSSHERSGLLAEVTAATENQPAHMAFIHQNFAEFLAATELINRPGLVGIILDRIEDPWWEQVILFAGAHRETPDFQRTEIINCLVNAAHEFERGSTGWQRRLVMAAHLARDMAKKFEGPEREDLEHVLCEAVTNAELEPTVRADVADALGEIWSPSDLYDFVEIRSDDLSRPSAKAADPTGALRGVATTWFYIAKHPVTNLQYARFLEADDFHEEKYWTKFPKYSEPDKNGRCKLLGDWGDEGYEWLKKNWDERKKVLPRYWTDPRFGIARRTAPVVGITWWEANAFCKWLTEHWQEIPEYAAQADSLRGKVFRLPTEPEWVLAAGGEAKDRYPWDEKGKATTDEDEILRRANTAESGINRTTPAGMYPLGRTTSGIWDMAGNVWEWQANFGDKDHDVLGLRGGSWGTSVSSSRVWPPATSGARPSNLWDYDGFRLVVFSPPT